VILGAPGVGDPLVLAAGPVAHPLEVALGPGAARRPLLELVPPPAGLVAAALVGAALAGPEPHALRLRPGLHLVLESPPPVQGAVAAARLRVPRRFLTHDQQLVTAAALVAVVVVAAAPEAVDARARATLGPMAGGPRTALGLSCNDTRREWRRVERISARASWRAPLRRIFSREEDRDGAAFFTRLVTSARHKLNHYHRRRRRHSPFHLRRRTPRTRRCPSTRHRGRDPLAPLTSPLGIRVAGISSLRSRDVACSEESRLALGLGESSPASLGPAEIILAGQPRMPCTCCIAKRLSNFRDTSALINAKLGLTSPARTHAHIRSRTKCPGMPRSFEIAERSR
jgi:hypothetical protein